jgi:predicted esterase
MGSLAPQHDSSGKLLPAILCLHGGGSNATVFKIQTRRLQWALNSQFRFVFARAPIEGTPGMGMLPVFKSCAPFYRWVSRRFKAGEADHEITPQEEVEAIDAILDKVIEENGGYQSFAGVIGFSQGARLTIGLLLRQLLEIRDYGESKWQLKFGVVVGGPFPPISLTPPEMEIDYELLKQIPTVHAWGRVDPVREHCKPMFEVCDWMNTGSLFMDFEGGHHLPLKDNEARDLCNLMLEAWHASGGSGLSRVPSSAFLQTC